MPSAYNPYGQSFLLCRNEHFGCTIGQERRMFSCHWGIGFDECRFFGLAICSREEEWIPLSLVTVCFPGLLKGTTSISSSFSFLARLCKPSEDASCARWETAQAAAGWSAVWLMVSLVGNAASARSSNDREFNLNLQIKVNGWSRSWPDWDQESLCSCDK